jgi:pimeloyl-ACP methyl ester carboxylesterase
METFMRLMTFSLAILLSLPLGCRLAYPQPLSIAMEEFAYPYPVMQIDLHMEGQPVRMAYMDVVPESGGNGRTVVLMHGRNFFGAYWAQTIRVLSRQGYRVVVPDQIGFGKSSKPDVPHSLHLHAHNTRVLLDALDVGSASIVGHSLGGMMAIRYALMFPESVDKLVLEAPIGLEDYRIHVPYASREELTREHLATTPDAFDRLFGGFFVAWDPAYQVYSEVQARWLQSPEALRIGRTAAHTWLMAYEQPVVYELALVRAPTLLVAGDKDRTAIGRNRVPAEVRARLGRYTELAPRAVSALPDGRLVMLENVGHIPHLEAADRFHRELLQFLSR